MAVARIWPCRCVGFVGDLAQEFVGLEDVANSRLWGRRGLGRDGDRREFELEIVIINSFYLIFFFMYLFVYVSILIIVILFIYLCLFILVY